MKRITDSKNRLIQLSVLFILSSIGVSCSDLYDEHYSMDNTERSDLNILDFMKSRDDLTKFVQLLEYTGYADTLALSQSFTVFALTNDALENLVMDEANRGKLKLQIGNHLTSYAQTSPGFIKAFNGKYLSLLKEDDKYYYAGVEIKEPNLLTKNGLVHIMGESVPYVFNIWEFIQQADYPIDSLRNYLNSLTELVFDTEKSYDENNVFIDSIFRSENRFLKELGPVDNELFYSTIIIPTNTAWDETYNKIFPYYRSLDKKENNVVIKTGLQLQEERAKWAVIQDNLFYGLVPNPVEKDSLISMSGNVFHNPQYLFEGADRGTFSNGYVFLTNQQKNKLEDSWLKTIKVESEYDQFSLRTYANCNIATNSSIGTSVVASNNYYVRLEPTTTNDNSKVWVKFPIPNTLANVKYNIYCVFIPTSAIDPTEEKSYKMNFYLSYLDEKGAKKTDVKIAGNLETEASQVTKLLVAENYQFSYCDLLPTTSANYSSDINVFLKIENAALRRESAFSRNIAIDCIILEPVIE
ncbi:fasciclin domain-containing protein [Bacteroidales bacterium OttesenSCG-928-L03]|nr:fasciclin domain-containing protein [Bacteroidales bacterium OttesenSCG-928-L03]